MKVIFLDIDGVLNSEKELRDAFNIEQKTQLAGISENKVKLLKEIIDKTGASIVLSSSWRLIDSDKEKVINMCNNNKIDYLGETCHGVRDDEYEFTYDRGAEIRKYILDYNICDYIVLDDEMQDIKDYISNKHLVETTLWDGLTQEKVNEAIKKLNISSKEAV